jgi:hypothetical protein
MSANAGTVAVPSGNAPVAILVGGLAAGTLDIAQAMILFGTRIPLVIAAGLLGRDAIKSGGTGTFILGLLLHFFIATSATAVFYFASRKLRFMVEYPLVCGLFFGMAVELFMRLIVLPLSALHSVGPYTLRDEYLGLGVHMVVVGLPIAYSVQRFGK